MPQTPSATTDVDFLSRIEANRFTPTINSATSPKNQARESEKKKAYWNENICLRLVQPGGNAASRDETTLNIPRFRLTESFLREAVNRGRSSSTSSTLLLSHIHDPKTNSVILPKDLRNCRPSPVIYNVHVVVAAGIERGGVLSTTNSKNSTATSDSYYKGDVIFGIENVPEYSKNGQFQVMSDDVHRWLVQGAIGNIEAIQILMDKTKTIEQTLERLEQEMKSINHAPIYNENGRAIVGSPLKDARESKHISLQADIGQTKNLLMKAQQSLADARTRHFEACEIRITQNKVAHGGMVSFMVKVMGKKKEKYENLIINKSDWSLVPMYATGDRAKNKSEADVTTIDQANQFVDVGSVRIVMLPDGFGVHEAYHEYDPLCLNDANRKCSRSNHRLFHGYFERGHYVKGTYHTEAAVFEGTFKNNDRPWKGTMTYSDGITVTSLSKEEAEDRLEAQIHFKDGASYRGELCHGHVTGKGIYKYPSEENHNGKCLRCNDDTSFSEISGEFANGHCDGEGQVYNNLPLSMMFDGVRTWGP